LIKLPNYEFDAWLVAKKDKYYQQYEMLRLVTGCDKNNITGQTWHKCNLGRAESIIPATA
jgi:hypothetical protein